MITKRDIIVFLAGASAFHTLSHMLLSATSSLPLTFIVTPELNHYATFINVGVTAALLWWAYKNK